MPADRFFIDADLQAGISVLVIGPEYHHLAHVMRLQKGEEIELVNGRGDLGVGTIIELNKKGSLVKLHRVSHEENTLPRFLLAVPLMRASKIEWVVEKGTELGADAFLFYPAHHSERETFSPRQLERLHLVTISALKQSGRLYLPSIEILPDMRGLFVKEACFLFGDLRSSASIEASSLQAFTTIFVTGPERGFSDEELSLLEKKAKGVRLSPYILRAETAPLAAASILGSLSKR